MKNKVGLGLTFCTVHRFAGLFHGRSLLSRILGLLLVWEGVVLGLLISLPKQGWKMNRRSTACNPSQVAKGLNRVCPFFFWTKSGMSRCLGQNRVCPGAFGHNRHRCHDVRKNPLTPDSTSENLFFFAERRAYGRL